jgi:hypothetical protein
MTKTLCALLVALVVALVGCSDDTAPTSDGSVPDLATQPDGAVPDGAVPDGAVPDGPAPDGAQPDGAQPDGAVGDGTPADLPGPDASAVPAAPNVTKPVANDKVFGAVDVQGTGEAGATVQVRLLLSTTELAKGTGTVDAQGDFALTLKYGGAAHNDPLSLEVWLENGAGASPVVTVALVHDAPYAIGGSISQTGGSNSGTEVFVRLYDSALDQDIINHIAEVKLAATDGQALAATAFSFSVADGTYYLRAFRDSGGPKGTAADGQPTLDSDAQAPAHEVVVSGGNKTGEDLVLKDRTNTSDWYGFDARTSNESPVAEPPSKWVGSTEVVGKGLCRGYLMRLEAQRQGTQLSAPMVRLPDGSVVTLLDDGGCSDAVLDNTASSYDHETGDNMFSYGIPDPTTQDAGTYTFFNVQTVDDFIHIEEDEVASVVKLPLLREMISPDGTATVQTLKPTLSWKAVPNAVYYEVGLGDLGGSYNNDSDPGRQLTGTTYTPATDVIDDACYDVKITVSDAPPTKDVDAVGHHSGSHRFCVDLDGANSITVSGAITDKTGENSPIVVHVRSDNSGHEATTRVAAGSTGYQVGLLAGSSSNGGSLRAFVDVDGTGDSMSPKNKPYSTDMGQLDLQQSATIDLTFMAPVLLTAPANGATATSLTPTFSWQDYAQTAGPSTPSGAFIYVIHIGEGGMPGTIYALPSTATSLDMANLPTGTGYFDVGQMATCVQGGGTFSLDAGGNPQCTGATMQASVNPLKTATLYSWGVVVLECDWSTYQPPAPSTAFLNCLATALSGSNYAGSEIRRLTTP